MGNNDLREFNIGELVRFAGHNIPGPLIPPTYILGRNTVFQSKFDMGIILADVEGVYLGRAYKVYWFKTKLITETFVAQLTRVY